MEREVFLVDSSLVSRPQEDTVVHGLNPYLENILAASDRKME